MALIQEQSEINERFSEALSLVGDGHFVFDGGEKYREALLLVLKEELHDQYDYIGWWLYEAADDYMVWTEDESKKWCLKEPAALYDYLVEICTVKE